MPEHSLYLVAVEQVVNLRLSDMFVPAEIDHTSILSEEGAAEAAGGAESERPPGRASLPL
jgi:hypothetical protein